MVTRTQIAKVFTDAKVKLARKGREINYSMFGDHGNEFICLAIDDTKNAKHARAAAKAVINKRLGKKATVECYVRDVLEISKKARTKNKLQTFRHAWIDSLIKEFSKKGNKSMF